MHTAGIATCMWQLCGESIYAFPSIGWEVRLLSLTSHNWTCTEYYSVQPSSLVAETVCVTYMSLSPFVAFSPQVKQIHVICPA